GRPACAATVRAGASRPAPGRAGALAAPVTPSGGSMSRALIPGITGQDGQFLAEFLHSKGYQVFGLIKGQNNPKGQQIQDEMPYVELVSGDLQDLPSLVVALEYTQPTEDYNVWGLSFVA